METLRIAAIMSAPVISLEADHSLSLANGIMNLQRVRHLPVTRSGRLIGLVTHRDLMAAQAAALAREAGPDEDLSVPVSRIMQTDLLTVTPETPVLEAARIMLDHHYGCLPVVEGGLLVGIVTEIDMLRLLVSALERRRVAEGAPRDINVEGQA